MSCRVDAEGVLFVHPQIPLQLCELLRIPALENAIKETLDTTSQLVKANDIQVCISTDFPLYLRHRL